MTRVLLAGLVALLVLAHAVLAQAPRSSRPTTSKPSREEAEAKVRDLIKSSALSRATLEKDSPIGMIGPLAQPPYATEVLGLTPEQIAAIKRLDEVAQAVRYRSLLAD